MQGLTEDDRIWLVKLVQPVIAALYAIGFWASAIIVAILAVAIVQPADSGLQNAPVFVAAAAALYMAGAAFIARMRMRRARVQRSDVEEGFAEPEVLQVAPKLEDPVPRPPRLPEMPPSRDWHEVRSSEVAARAASAIAENLGVADVDWADDRRRQGTR